MTPEDHAMDIQRRHDISQLRIFAEGGVWRVFAARGLKKFMASVEEGRGIDIKAALCNLDDRIKAGPWDKDIVAPLLELPK